MLILCQHIQSQLVKCVFANCNILLYVCHVLYDLYFPCWSFSGNLSVWSIIHWFTMARIAAQNTASPKTGRTFLEYNKLTAELFTFFVCTRLSVSKQFYDLVHSGFVQSRFPQFNISCHLGYAGVSSLNIVGVLRCSGSGSELARLVNQVCFSSECAWSLNRQMVISKEK